MLLERVAGAFPEQRSQSINLTTLNTQRLRILIEMSKTGTSDPRTMYLAAQAINPDVNHPTNVEEFADSQFIGNPLRQDLKRLLQTTQKRWSEKFHQHGSYEDSTLNSKIEQMPTQFVTNTELLEGQDARDFPSLYEAARFTSLALKAPKDLRSTIRTKNGKLTAKEAISASALIAGYSVVTGKIAYPATALLATSAAFQELKHSIGTLGVASIAVTANVIAETALRELEIKSLSETGLSPRSQSIIVNNFTDLSPKQVSKIVGTFSRLQMHSVDLLAISLALSQTTNASIVDIAIANLVVTAAMTVKTAAEAKILTQAFQGKSVTHCATDTEPQVELAELANI